MSPPLRNNKLDSNTGQRFCLAVSCMVNDSQHNCFFLPLDVVIKTNLVTSF